MDGVYGKVGRVPYFRLENWLDLMGILMAESNHNPFGPPAEMWQILKAQQAEQVWVWEQIRFSRRAIWRSHQILAEEAARSVQGSGPRERGFSGDGT